MAAITDPPTNRFKTTLVGAAFGLFALGALTTALLLEGPAATESPYLLATAPAVAGARPVLPVPPCANCGVIEAVTAQQREAATVYDITVRMADGSLRHLALTQPLPLGKLLHLEGGRITVLPEEGS